MSIRANHTSSDLRTLNPFYGDFVLLNTTFDPSSLSPLYIGLFEGFPDNHLATPKSKDVVRFKLCFNTPEKTKYMIALRKVSKLFLPVREEDGYFLRLNKKRVATYWGSPIELHIDSVHVGRENVTTALKEIRGMEIYGDNLERCLEYQNSSR